MIYTADWRSPPPSQPPQTVANRFAGGNFALSSVRVVYILIKISNRRPTTTSEKNLHCGMIRAYVFIFFLFALLRGRPRIVADDTHKYISVTDYPGVIVRPRNVTDFEQVITFPGSSSSAFSRRRRLPGPILLLYVPYYVPESIIIIIQLFDAST